MSWQAALEREFSQGTQSGAPPSVRPEWMDPSDVEKELQPEGHQPLAPPAPMQVMTADKSGRVPMPTRAPSDPGPETARISAEPAAPIDEPPTAGQVNVPARVQTDPSHIVVADVVLGGMLPWLQAAADLATGNITKDQFEQARVAHSKQMEDLRGQHPELIGAAEKAMPFLSGLGIGVLKPASSVAGTMARGALVGAAESGVRGYTSGPAEEPSTSSQRMAQGLGHGAVGAVAGAAGASVPGAVGVIGQKLEQRAATRAAESAAAAVTEKKAATVAKGKATKQANAEARQRAEQYRLDAEAQKAELEHKASQFENYRTPPKNVSTKAKENREDFNKDPIDTFRRQAALKPTLDSFAYNTGMSPVAILAKLHGKVIPSDTPAEKALAKNLAHVQDSWVAYKNRGPNANASTVQSATGGGAPSSAGGGTAASTAGKSSAKPASGNGSSASGGKANGRATDAIRTIAKRVREPKS